MKKVLLSSAVMALFASGASAAVFDIDFSVNSAVLPQSSLTFNDAGGSGLTLDVTASEYNIFSGALQSPSYSVGQYFGGLGVCSGTVTDSGDGCSGDNHQVDGSNGDEIVIFSFSDVVEILSVTLSLVGGNDQFDFITYEPDNEGLIWSVDPAGTGTVTTNTADFVNTASFYPGPQSFTGSLFGVGAPLGNDEFKITGLSFDYTPAPVPLPAAGWMLIAGIGGLAAMRRRQTKTAA